MQEDFFLLGTISQNKNKIEIVPPGLLQSGTNLYQKVKFLLKIFDALEWTRSKVQDFVSLWTKRFKCLVSEDKPKRLKSLRNHKFKVRFNSEP